MTTRRQTTAEHARVFAHVGLDDTIGAVTAHPACRSIRAVPFPVEHGPGVPGLTIAEVGRLLPSHGHVDPATTVTVINAMIDRINAGKTDLLRRLHAAAASRRPRLASTGLFSFQGQTGRALRCGLPRRRFSTSVRSMKAFPMRWRLSQQDITPLCSNTGSETNRPPRGSAAAVSFILENASTLEVSTTGYSLWGSSAGARMVANIGSFGLRRFGGREFPGPSTVIMAYTGRPSIRARIRRPSSWSVRTMGSSTWRP